MSQPIKDPLWNLRKARRPYRKILKRAEAATARGDTDEANKLCLEYLQHVPDDPTVLFNMGTMRMRRASNEWNPALKAQISKEALAYFQAVLGSPWPDYETKAHAANNAGLVVSALGNPSAARKLFEGAQFYLPGHRAARVNGADVLIFEGNYGKADRELADIISSDPEHAGTFFCRGLIKLTHGDFERGWMEYRARFYMKAFKSKMVETDKPLWDGEPLDDKTLLLSCEQGYGDHIQFIRYAREIKKRWPSSKVFYSVEQSMHKLLNGTVGLDGCLPDHTTDEFKALDFQFAYHAPLLHCPDILRTTLATVPAECPYIVPQADWEPLTLEGEKRPRIGLVWAGSPIHGKDRWRSMRPEQFQRFIDAKPDAQFYSLQCGPRAHEAAELKNCIDLAPAISEWTQTANAILQMDMVICVDTAIAHLAGALDVPAWILIPASPDFRWMLGRTDSPWYPKARLFRQKQAEQWDPAIEEVCNALKNL